MVCVLPARGLFLALYFYVRFILLFCLVAIWKVPSEWLTAISVNFQCGSSADLLPSLLSLQQVPREPRWTWQEPRPCLRVVTEGQSALPAPQAPAGWLSQRAGLASVRLPLASASLLALFQSASATWRWRRPVLQET